MNTRYNLNSLVLNVEENKSNWTLFNNQINFTNKLPKLASNDYEDRVYKGSNFLGSIKREERNEKSKTRKLNKKHTMKNRDY